MVTIFENKIQFQSFRIEDMRQNSVEADIAAWKYVNLLSIRELFNAYFL